jgi:hypothetical protein
VDIKQGARVVSARNRGGGGEAFSVYVIGFISFFSFVCTAKTHPEQIGMVSTRQECTCAV